MSARNVRLLPLLAFAATLLRSGSAHADDPTLAQQLFERGRQAMAREDYRGARAQFEASYQAEPALGAILNLAVCEEKLGLWNAALKHLGQGMQDAAPDDKRRPSLAARIEELRLRVPHLTLRLRAPLATGVVILLDATSIDLAALAAPLPVDPGPHSVRCQADTGVLCAHDFVAHERESIEWSIDLDSKGVAVGAPNPQRPAPVGDATTAGKGPRRLPALSLWAGGVGLASLALGLAAGAEVLHLKNTTAQHCDPTGCDEAGVAAAGAGKTWSWVSTVATGFGALGLGTSVALAVTSRPSQGLGAEMAVRGRF